MTTKVFALFIVLLAITAAGASETQHLEQMIARFVPTEIKADVSKLSPNDRRVLAKLIEASKIVDGIFLRQVWNRNVSTLIDL